MDAATHLTWLRREGALLAAIPADGLLAPVSGCPGWSVERLIGHVGRVHVWAASYLRNGPRGDAPDAGPRPPRGAAVLSWYAECLEALLDEMGRHDPGEPSMSFAGPAPAGFWFRRQAHEVGIHRWDAQNAVEPGRAAAFEATQAADGVDEWLTVFVPRRLAADGIPSALVGADLHLHATDAQAGWDGLGEWTLRFTADGPQAERGHAKGAAALRGPAAGLLLRVWHRRGGPDVEVFGDGDVANAMLDTVHVG